MIRYIKGNLIHKEDNSAVVENNGIGYNIFLPMSSKLYTKNLGDIIEVFTSMIVREDDISLYGFSHMDELRLFEKLITVNGVGAKAAISIFSALNVNDIKLAIFNEDPLPLTKASGIGKKTAQRIVLDLKDKIDVNSNIQVSNSVDSNLVESSAINEAVLALETMGFARNDILPVIKNIEGQLTVEEYIKRLLKHFA